jgi:hypothetical protein
MNAAVEILARTTEGQKSGPLALAVILVLCVVCYFLFKSMSRHLKKVRDDFPTTPPAAPPTAPPAAEAIEPPAVPATGSDGTADGSAPGA